MTESHKTRIGHLFDPVLGGRRWVIVCEFDGAFGRFEKREDADAAARAHERASWKRGDRARWYVWTGGETQGLVYGTVTRIGPRYVRVRPDGGDGTVGVDAEDLFRVERDEDPLFG